MKKITCPHCQEETVAEVEQIEQMTYIEGMDEFGQFEYTGQAKTFYDNAVFLMFWCTACNIPIDLEDLNKHNKIDIKV